MICRSNVKSIGVEGTHPVMASLRVGRSPKSGGDLKGSHESVSACAVTSRADIVKNIGYLVEVPGRSWCSVNHNYLSKEF